MHFQYLGTAAAEGWPAVFCNCPLCKRAALLGGRNIRTRSQALINKDLLIDLPPDTYMHKLTHGLDLTAVRYLLVTHMHMDHFYPQELTVRGSGYSHDMVSPDLNIFCAQETKDYFYQVSKDELDAESDRHLIWNVLKPFETVQAGPYTVTPLPASHMSDRNQPFIYHITDREGKQVLYLHDSGWYEDDVWDYFAGLSKPVDMISLDSTNGAIESHRGHHMGVSEAAEVRDRLRELGAIDDHTRCFLNHFSHNGGLLYDDLTAKAAPLDLEVSYDGMEIDL